MFATTQLNQKGLELEYDPDLDSSLPVEKSGPNMHAIRRAMEMSMDAERPMLTLGGRVIIANTSDELMALGEYLQILLSSLPAAGLC